MNKKTFIIIAVFIIVLSISIISVVLFNNNTTSNNDNLLYSTVYYFAFGSRHVKIFSDGKVYDDIEIEEPNHQPNYKYLKTINNNELKDIKSMLENKSNDEEIRNYIIQLVYGVKKFDNYGNY